jgi:membrane associated rhomboid family serine protease
MYRPSGFATIPLVIKNLLIINVLVFILMSFLERAGSRIPGLLMMHYFQSEDFRPHQMVTHMFMHGSFMHLFGNMLSLWVFGSMLEGVWGPKRFLIFYMVTGVGAALCDQIYLGATRFGDIRDFQALYESTGDLRALQVANFLKESFVTLGASGAVYGVLMGAALLFPNTEVYLYFAIPLKIKWLAIIMGVGELFATISANPGDNINHFVHLSGMAFSFVLIQLWKKKRNTFY